MNLLDLMMATLQLLEWIVVEALIDSPKLSLRFLRSPNGRIVACAAAGELITET